MTTPTIQWDLGTAYDLFISLQVLHRPNAFGLRAAWAAGMRSRLPTAEREFFEGLIDTSFMHGASPRWCYELPAPKDGATAIEVLAETPVRQRLPALVLEGCKEWADVEALQRSVLERGSWTESEAEWLRAAWQKHEAGKVVPNKMITAELDLWAHAEEFGERVVDALQAYYEVFYAEEERRIQPMLEAELERARELAAQADLLELLETLSRGVRLTEMPKAEELVLVPTYWGSPFLFFGCLDERREIMLFAARPEDASVVPGEIVPDALVSALKAMSDPTRLRILRYLTTESLTPTQLARRLRLRAPTVIHHLHALRSAELVKVSLGDSKEKAYQARLEGIHGVCDALLGFLQGGK
jgi:DNA-binding transcriptional ArsR family regulator